MGKSSRAKSVPDSQACDAALKACACLNFRKASRIVTRFYDEVLQPTGLRSTQLVILLSIRSREPATTAQVARDLVMDPSTLNRNLRPLRKKKLVESKAAPDGRRRLLSLTEEGRNTIAQAVPYWQEAQSRFVELLGAKRWRDLTRSMANVVARARGG